MFDKNVPIISNENIAKDHFLLSCEFPEISTTAKPGQFVHIKISDSFDPFLRRPLTIYWTEKDRISMLYQIVGKGTKLLSTLKSGSSIGILGPLGNCFGVSRERPIGGHTMILVGGGAGIASLMLLAKVARSKGVHVIAIVGAATEARLLSVDRLEGLGVETCVATVDGSVGRCGFVTEFLDEILISSELKNPAIYACGPIGMLRAVSEIAKNHRLPCEIAMENRMGCAMGVCLGCVCKVRHGTGFQLQRVCVEGPIFDSTKIIFPGN